MLIMVVGDLGCGKTLFLTILGYFSDKIVVSNYKTSFPNKKSEEFNINTFIRGQYENRRILLDEAYTFLESRTSGANLNKLMSYILFQSRKRGIDMILSVQLLSTIDLRYRHLTDLYIEAKTDGKNYIYELWKKHVYLRTLTIPIPNVFPFYQMYDTNELVLPDIDNVLQKSLTVKEKVHEVKLIADQILDEYPDREFTVKFISWYFFNKGLPTFLEGYTHTEIKERIIQKNLEEKKAREKELALKKKSSKKKKKSSKKKKV